MSRKIEVQIVGNASSLHRALGESTSGASRLGSAFSSAARLAAGLGLALGAAEVFRFGKDAIMAAAQVQKSTEAIRADYGKASGSVISFGERAANAFGISNQASTAFSAQIGITAKNIGLAHGKAAEMDIGLQRLAGSIGLIKGQDPSAVFSTLTLALAGNTRGLKALGIVITPVAEKQELLRLGIHKSVADLTAAQKAQVIYGIATKHLGDLQKQARQHAGDFSNQIVILKARLSNLADSIAAKALPVVSGLVGFISKIAAAPNLKVGVHVLFSGIESGAKSIAAGIQHALLGSTKTVTLKAPSGLILGSKQETSKGIVQQILSALKTADWSGIGKEVGSGISRSIKFSAGALDNLVSGLVDAVTANKDKIAAAGILIAAAMFTTILSADFWISHWKVALGVAVAALGVAFTPEKFLAPLRALPFAKFIITPLEKLGGPLKKVAEMLGRGIMSGLRIVFPEIEKTSVKLSEKIVGPMKSLPGRAAGIIEAMGRWIGGELGNTARMAFKEAAHVGSRIIDALDNFIGAAGNVASRIATRIITPLENLAGRVTGPIGRMGRTIVHAIGGFIGNVFSEGAQIGRAILDGIISGVQSLAGALYSKLSGILSGLPGAAKKLLGISSPSKVFAEQVGKPIAEGIALGITQHAHKVSGALIGAVSPRGGMGGGGMGGGGGRGPIVIENRLYLDGREVTNWLQKADKDYRRQNAGRPMLSGR